MTLTLGAESPPLSTDADGVVRVGGTRVTLDTVIAAFSAGATAEEIAQQHPLSLADVYAAVGYYLKHRAEVDLYLRERQRRAATVRRQNEENFDPMGIRERLLARRAKVE